jgi:hypothetical protein
VDKTVPVQYVDFFIQTMRNQQRGAVGATPTSSANIRVAYDIVGILNDNATALTYSGTPNN